LAFLVPVALVATAGVPVVEPRSAAVTNERLQRVVFVVSELPRTGGGGGGGGNRESGPIRRARGIGTDAITLRVRKPVATTAAPPSAEPVPSVAALLLDAKPLASGMFEQVGLPSAAGVSGTSTGPGSGGGVGTGAGTGIGSGRGPGLGPGSGGGAGGGVYRPGGGVSAPRLLREVRPRYTEAAIRNMVQGAVLLEVIVTSDGRPSHLRVIRSLDRGLDEEAMAAVAQWRFEPGRLAGAPVDVLVTITVDFSIR
jgi:TonB family protein